MRGRRDEAVEGGFTLVELMVVVGIAAILASILTLGIRRVSESFALRQAAAVSAVEVRNAQGGAISSGASDTRSVTVVGIENSVLVSDAFVLNGIPVIAASARRNAPVMLHFQCIDCEQERHRA